jgi:ADP-heptose:LPS heptosyltransferase
MRNFHIRLKRRGPGDTIAATAFIRDYMQQFPDSRLSIDGTLADEIFQYGPYVLEKALDAEVVEIDYKNEVDRSCTDHTARYMLAAHDAFFENTGIRVTCTSPKPHLELSDDERVPEFDHPYVVIASGVKLDIPTKRYPPDLWQRIADLGARNGWRLKQVGLIHDGRFPHIQTSLAGADNLLGKTSIRRLIRLIKHAQGVICHVSLPFMIASAFNVPCVVIGGGREDPWFFEGMGAEYLHTIGSLPCCAEHGCRTMFPIPAHEGPHHPGSICTDPVVSGGSWVGRCMTMITPEAVVASLANLMA